jgi:multidrug efflux system membrane fusion protein
VSAEETKLPGIPHAEPVPHFSSEPDGGSSALIWITVAVVAVVAFGGAFLYWKSTAAKDKSAAVSTGGKSTARATPVVSATARKGDLPIYLTGLGAVTALNTVTLHTRVDGELMNVAFKEGDSVKEGDLLAEIDPRPFQVQLAIAQGQLKKDTATNQQAKLDLERYQQATSSDLKAVSDQVVSAAKATLMQTEGALAIDQAAIDNAKLQLTYCHITSPITGRIGLRLVDKGNIVHANDQQGLAVITQLQPIAAIFALPQDDLGQILPKLGKGEALRVDIFGRDLKKRLAQGTLLTVDNQINPTTGTVNLKAVFPNTDDAHPLFPNQFVNARLLIEVRKDVILVPVAAVQQSPAAKFVYAVKGSGQEREVEQRTVKTGPSEGEDIVVEDGIAAGEVVVIEGVDKLQTGAKVTLPDSDGDHKKGEKPEKGEKSERGEKPEKSERGEKAGDEGLKAKKP